MTETFRLPRPDQRVSISGRTGSGKSVFGIWLFGMAADFHRRPYVFIDYKKDKLINQIPRLEILNLNEVPKYPGVYALRPDITQQDEVENWLWKVHGRENIGLFADEGYMLPMAGGLQAGAVDAILTQGRSKRISLYTLTQRPVKCSRFVFSEADYYACFHLNDKRDHDTVKAFLPDNEVFDMSSRLPKYTARWYDVAQDYSAIIKPVPPEVEILDMYDRKTKPKLRRL